MQRNIQTFAESQKLRPTAIIINILIQLLGCGFAQTMAI